MSKEDKALNTEENVVEEANSEQIDNSSESFVPSDNKVLKSLKYFLTIGIVLGIFVGLVWQPTNSNIGTKVLFGMLIFGGLGAVIGLLAGFLGGKKKEKEEQ